MDWKSVRFGDLADGFLGLFYTQCGVLQWRLRSRMNGLMVDDVDTLDLVITRSFGLGLVTATIM